MPPHGHQTRHGQAGVLALVAFAAIVFATPVPAGAHPFGDPQTVAIALDRDHPDVVRIRWKIGGLDDLTLLGVALGLLPPDRVMLDGAVFFQPSDAAVIGPSDRFAAYLLKQITVDSDGHACTGSVEPPGDLAKTGVTVDYTCPGPVGTATVAVRMLTDLDPAYQTLAAGPDGRRAVYRSDQYSHDWTLGDAPPTGIRPGRSAAIQITLVAGVALTGVAATLVLLRRYGRRRAVA